jgi:hypothetical protein
MSKKLKLLQKVLDVRERLRDAASATAQIAESKKLHAETEHQRAKDAHDAILDESNERLVQASEVRTLIELDAERILAEHITRERAKEMRAKTVEADKAREQLRARSRDVRVFEKVIEDVRVARDKRIAKHEQGLADDIVGWRSAS